HLYIGEEAVAAGSLRALTMDDAIVATYREHGQALVRGTPAAALMAELYGKANGCSRGHGGSMHFFDVSRRFYGGNAIVGSGSPCRGGAHGKRTAVPRGPHLSLSRSLDVRSGSLSHQGRDRALEGAGPDPGVRGAPARMATRLGRGLREDREASRGGDRRC